MATSTGTARMQDEAKLIAAAFKLLEQQRRAGKVNLREVAENARQTVEAANTDCPVSAEESRRLLCELIKSEVGRRWEEAAASVQAQSSDQSIARADRSADRSELLRRLDAPPIPDEFRPPTLESFLAQWPGELDDQTSIVDLSAHEFSVRQLSGDEPQIAEYEERFANLADAIRGRIDDLEESLNVESSIRMLLRNTDPLFRARQINQKRAVVVAPARASDSSDNEPVRPDSDEQERAILCRVLERVEFFRDLSPELRLAVVKKLELTPFSADDYLICQGEPADGLVVLLEGTATVTVEEHERVHDIATLNRRTVIGEMGLVTQSKRTASVVADSDGWMAKLLRDDFESLAGRYPLLGISLSELISQRLGTVAVDALCGKTIDCYEIRRRLGRGGMAVVYLAEDREASRPVALKMLPHDRALDLLSSRRFRQEAGIVRDLTHPNIVRVWREFSAFGTTFIAMEWCDGPSLADVIRVAGPLPAAIVRQIIGQIAAGLAHTHAAGIAHRDLKPSNVLLTRSGEVKLADFGLARAIGISDSELTGIGEMLGTPRYMAPEQIEGERGDQKSDLFSLACIAYELWTGLPMFQSLRWRDLLRERAVWSLAPQGDLKPAMDDEMYAILAHCLREDPKERSLDLAAIARWGAPVDWSTLPNVAANFEAQSAEPTLDV